MNYNDNKTKAFSLTKLGLDKNGNTKRKMTFYKRINGIMERYKTTTTNESIFG